MKHAYLVIAHNEPEILLALLTFLDDKNNDVFLHIDSKADNLYEKIKQQYKGKKNIILLSHRMDIRWGGTSQMLLELSLIKFALNYGEYSYIHLLSGVDLPIKPLSYIYNFFENSGRKNFIGFHQVGEQMDNVNYHHLFIEHLKDKNPLVKVLLAIVRRSVIKLEKYFGFKRKYPYEIRKGPQWFSITQEFATFLISQENQILKIFRYIPCCDEIFMQTIIWNSHFRRTLWDVDDEYRGCMRAIDWNRGCPYVWQKGDFEELKSSEMLFARKFSMQNGKEIIDAILSLVRV